MILVLFQRSSAQKFFQNKKLCFSWLLDVIVCAVPGLVIAVNNKRAYFWEKSG
jgi:hypothetical protein